MMQQWQHAAIASVASKLTFVHNTGLILRRSITLDKQVPGYVPYLAIITLAHVDSLFATEELWECQNRRGRTRTMRLC